MFMFLSHYSCVSSLRDFYLDIYSGIIMVMATVIPNLSPLRFQMTLKVKTTLNGYICEITKRLSCYVKLYYPKQSEWCVCYLNPVTKLLASRSQQNRIALQHGK
jgi:hypothetical protein